MVTLTRVGTTYLFVSHLARQPDAQTPRGTFCFLAADTPVKDTLTLAEAAALPGAFAFADRAIEGQFAAMRSLMQRYLNATDGMTRRALIWTRYGADIHAIVFLRADGAIEHGTDLKLWQFVALPGSQAVECRFACEIPGGTSVEFATDGLTLTHPDLRLKINGLPRTLYLPVEKGALTIDISDSVHCGRLSAPLGDTSSAALLKPLGPHVSYFWEEDIFEQELRSTLLSRDGAAHTNLAISVEFDPYSSVYPLSRCRFVGDDIVLQSTLLDVYAHAIKLHPQTKDDGGAVAEIYFEQTPRVYASLCGDFLVQGAPAMASDASVRDVMVGAAGTELFQLGAGYDGLRFVRGGHAWFEWSRTDEAATLTDKHRTAWVAPCRIGQRAASTTGGYRYVAQPEAQPLSGRRAPLPWRLAGQQNMLAFDPAPRSVADTASMPILPLRALDAARTGDALWIDGKVLSTVRGAVAASAPAPRRTDTLPLHRADGDGPWITTPQGLLVQVDENNDWKKIQIATSVVDGQANPIDWTLSIKRPEENGKPVQRWALQEALSRSEVFVVISSLPTPRFDEPVCGPIELTMKIGKWGFDHEFKVDSDQSERLTQAWPHMALMVIKLGKGTIRDLAADMSRWTMARTFNTDPASASADLVASVNGMKALSEGRSPVPLDPGTPPELSRIPAELRPHYTSLYQRLTDPDWNGVAVFNAGTESIPPEAGVVNGGGDEADRSKPGDRFLVPLLGIDLNRLLVDAGAIVPGKTSAFAAVHHHSPARLKEGDDGDGGFKFKLRNLNAIFENTELRTFLASMDLRLGSYFGSKTSSKTDSRVLDIAGRYEQHGGPNGEARYLFRALGSRTLHFGDDGLLAKLTITRLDVTTTVESDGAASRFGLFGELAFTERFTKVTGVRKVSFDNAGLIMKNGKFDVDAGQVRVDFNKKDQGGALDSLLGDFPFKLSGLRWSGGKLPIKMPDIGFAPLDLDMGIGKGEGFDFGLELDLNLGSLGKLADAAQFLKGKVLVGWTDMSGVSTGIGSWTVGFRFDGGSGPLDIGINGVLRLRADKVFLKSYSEPGLKGVGLGLEKPQLEVMGYKIPKEPKSTLLAFIPHDAREKLGWVWASDDLKVGPLTLDWFALGQRMNVAGVVAPRTALNTIIDNSVELFKDGIPDVGTMYDENAGWALVARGKLGGFATRLVFLDGPAIYGLGVDIPAIAKVDIVYRKLAADLGVFAGEITPIKRSFEMGAANVTLPIFSFEAFTNGNWSINIGFNGNDFSRGTTVQLLPFLGSGGLRFGRLDWRSSYVLYGPYTTPCLTKLYEVLAFDPVFEFSMALRVGIGKEIDEGIFKAGVSLSVYGIFEGAFAVPGDRAFPRDIPKRYLKLSGTAGILLEIYGAVNFSVISAAVSIRAWVEQGLILETWQPVLINAAAGVSVRVRFVVAEFRVFGKKVVIAIHFSFSYTVRFSVRLPVRFDGDMPEQYRDLCNEWRQESRLPRRFDALDAVKPLEWVMHTLSGARQTLEVGVAAEPMLRDAEAVIVPMLLASHVPGADNPLAGLAVDLLRWSLRLVLGVPPAGGDPAEVTMALLEHLKYRLQAPAGKSLARWGAAPLDFAAVRTFLISRLAFQLHSAEALLKVQQLHVARLGLVATDQAQGILLPWFGELGIFASDDGGPEKAIRDLYGADRQEIDPTWEALLFKTLQRTRPDYEPEHGKLLKASFLRNGLYVSDVSSKPAVDAIVEDWAAALLLGIVQRAIEVFRAHTVVVPDEPPSVLGLAALCSLLLASAPGKDCIALQVAQQASAFLQHGARVPAAPDSSAGGDIALTELLRLDIGLAELPQGSDVALTFRPLQAGLFADHATFGTFDPAQASDALAEARDMLLADPIILEVEVETGVIAERRFPCDKEIPLAMTTAPATTLRYLPFPSWIALTLAQPANSPLSMALQLDVEHAERPARTVDAPRWVSKIDLRIREIREGGIDTLESAQGVYAISGVDERVRSVLQVLDGGAAARIHGARLAYRPPPGGAVASAAAGGLRFLAGDEAFVFVSNLSQEGAPPEELAGGARLQTDTMPVFASLSSPDALVKILLMASVVNGPGFQLGFTVSDPFAGMFTNEQAVVISILLECELVGQPTTVQGFMDGVLFDAGHLQRGESAVLITPAYHEARSDVPDGQVALRVHRPNPLPADDPTPAGPVRDAKALAARFRLVDYAVTPGGQIERVERAEVSAAGVDLTDEELEDIDRDREPDHWRHRVLVPLARFTAPVPPSRDAGPYALVGTDLSERVKLGLRDGAGHVMADAMLGAPVWADPLLRYRTALTRFDEFAGVSANWVLQEGGGQGQVGLEFVWEPAGLYPVTVDGTPDDSRRKALQTEYLRLAQMCSGPGFEARVQLRIGGAALADAAITTELSAWVAAIADALAQSGTAPAPLRLTLPLGDAAALLGERPLEMRALLAFSRPPGLCDSTLGAEVAAVESVLSPRALADQLDWKAWAQTFKRVFGDTLRLLRRVRMDRQRGAIWVVPGAMVPASATRLRVKEAFFLAPAPLAKTFRSGTVEVPAWQGGRRQVEARDVDLNVLGGSAAALLERFLSARAGYALCRAHSRHFSTLAGAKRVMADGLARRLRSVFEEPTHDPKDVRDKFRNASGADLRVAFDPVVSSSVRLDDSAAGTVFLYGTAAVETSSRHTITPIRVPLGAQGMHAGFSFVARWFDPGDQPSAVLVGPLRFAPRYIEVRNEAGAVNDYVPSDWYEIIWADPETDRRITFLPPVSGDVWRLPLPLRLVPPTPVVIRHGGVIHACAQAASSLAEFVRRLRTWEYQVDVAIPREEHDQATVEIAFTTVSTRRLHSEDRLFEALVAYSANESELLALLSQLEAGQGVREADLVLAGALFGEVGAALLAYSDARLESSRTQEEVLKLVLSREREGTDRLLKWEVASGVKRPVVARLFPYVSDSSGAEVQPIHPPVNNDADGMARYRGNDIVNAAFDGGAGLSARRVSVSALDILKQAGARSSVRARRNEKLAGQTVAPVFVFDTAEVKSADAFMPHVRNTEAFDITTSIAGQKTLCDWLVMLEQALFDGDPAIRQRYSLDASASLRCPFGENAAHRFQYPLHSMRGVPAGEGGWVSAWQHELEAAVLRVDRSVHDRAELVFDIKVYANVNADKPVISMSTLFLPLHKIEQGTAPCLHHAEKAKRTHPPGALQIAGMLYAESSVLHGDAAERDKLLAALSAFAAAYRGAGLKTGRMPGPVELASPVSSACWESCLVHAQGPAAGQASRWGSVTLWPAAQGGERPAPGVEAWFAPDFEPGVAVQTEKIAGPFLCTDPVAGLALGVPLFLWGLQVGATVA